MRGMKKWGDNFSVWLTYKNPLSYYSHLELLTNSVNYIFKEEKTINHHEVLTNSVSDQLTIKEQVLFRETIHSLTLLNHLHRVYVNNQYESTLEDVLNASKLFQISYNSKSLLSTKTKLLYWALEEHYGGKEFTLKEASFYLLLNKNTLRNHVIQLLNTGYLEQTRTGRNNTKYYQVISS